MSIDQFRELINPNEFYDEKLEYIKNWLHNHLKKIQDENIQHSLSQTELKALYTLEEIALLIDIVSISILDACLAFGMDINETLDNILLIPDDNLLYQPNDPYFCRAMYVHSPDDRYNTKSFIRISSGYLNSFNMKNNISKIALIEMLSSIYISLIHELRHRFQYVSGKVTNNAMRANIEVVRMMENISENTRIARLIWACYYNLYMEKDAHNTTYNLLFAKRKIGFQKYINLKDFDNFFGSIVLERASDYKRELEDTNSIVDDVMTIISNKSKKDDPTDVDLITKFYRFRHQGLLNIFLNEEDENKLIEWCKTRKITPY